MSEETALSLSGDVAASPSLLTNLRGFRFKKSMLPKLKPGIPSNSSEANQPLRSGSKENSKSLNVSQEIQDYVKEEESMKSLQEAFPNLDEKTLRDKLSSCGGNVDDAMISLCSPTKSSPQKNSNRRLDSVTLNSSEIDTSFVDVQPRKKVRRLEMSDDEDEEERIATTQPEVIMSDSEDCKEKERSMKFLREACPNIADNVLRDRLICCDWNPQEALIHLIPSPVKASNQKKSQMENNPKKRKKKSRRRTNSGDSSEGEVKYKSKTVFDSSDSEQELDRPNKEQMSVLDFLSTATNGELLGMPSCSAKKVNAIVELRPFPTWRNLVTKLKKSPVLATSILSSAQECLRSRQVVQKLMKKCIELANQMETAVEAGATHITKQPSNLNTSLKLAGYQLVGLNWLITMNEQGLNGILADEMGLGKTVQVIALLAHLKEVGYERVGPHLIVVPASTLENWGNELARWCPDLRVVMYYGNQDERKEIRRQWIRDSWEDVDVVVSTYNIVGTSPDERKMFRVWQTNYVILDEAHMLKNMATIRYENLMKINAKHRILLTGTPLQNTLLELMSLLIFVMPHMFSGKRDYLKSLFQKAPPTSSDGTLDVPRFEQTQVAQARRIMQPFVLRRLKCDVLKDLPKKTDSMVLCKMMTGQRKLYDKAAKSFSKDAQEEELDEIPSNSMAIIMQLRKIANHPTLVQNHYTKKQLDKMANLLTTDPLYKTDVLEHIRDDLSYMSDFEIHQMTLTYKSLYSFKLPEEKILDSGKFNKLDELLPRLKEEGHRVLIFSQFVIMLNVLEEYLRLRKHKFLRLDGQTPVLVRQELIDKYTNDDSFFIFLLSTRAGGLGINLTAADTVLIHDIDYNPYNDKQAEDRCHRMGQKRDVTVVRMVAEKSIEEGMFQIAQEKLHLEKEITNEDGPIETKSIARLLRLSLGIDSKTLSSPIKAS